MPKVLKNKNFLSFLKSLSLLNHPTVMGGGAETTYNQITFIFSKEQHGNTLSMHLTKFRK